MRDSEQLGEVDPATAAGLLVADLWLDGVTKPTGADAARAVGLTVIWVDRIDLEEETCAPGAAVLFKDAGVIYVSKRLTLDEENRAIAHEVGHWLARRRGWPKPVEEEWADRFGQAFAEAVRCEDAAE